MKNIRDFLSVILRLEGLFMVVPLLISLFCGERAAARGFALSLVIIVCVSFMLSGFRFRFLREGQVYRREGFLLVALSWVMLSVFGALPMWLSGASDSYYTALFESISAFTTTAASTIPDMAALPRGLLFWNCFSQWIGGMGVLLLLVALTPRVPSGDNYNLLRAELPGHTVGRVVPKLGQNAKLLYAIYGGMTLTEALLLLAGGIPLFDSVATALVTAGTGGFSIRSGSLGAHDSLYMEIVVIVFMILFSVNFSVHYCILTRNWAEVKANDELKWYLSILGIATILVACNLARTATHAHWGESLYHAFFQVTSMASSTGFSLVDFNVWPQFSKAVLLLVGIMGACVGSTGGGLKIFRVVILLREMRRRLYRLYHPRAVEVITLDGEPVDRNAIHNINTYVLTLLAIYAGSLLVVALDGLDFETTFSAVSACLNNVGTGFGSVAADGGYRVFSPLSRLVLMANMFLGRLEIYPVLLLFSARTWRAQSQRHPTQAQKDRPQ